MNTWKVNQDYRAPKQKREVPEIYYLIFFMSIAVIILINTVVHIEFSAKLVPQIEAEQVSVGGR